MNKYRVHYKVLAQHFGEEMTRGQIEVFANSLDEAKQKVEAFITENVKQIDPNAQYFGDGGRQLTVGK